MGFYAWLFLASCLVFPIGYGLWIFRTGWWEVVLFSKTEEGFRAVVARRRFLRTYHSAWAKKPDVWFWEKGSIIPRNHQAYTLIRQRQIWLETKEEIT